MVLQPPFCGEITFIHGYVTHFLMPALSSLSNRSSVSLLFIHPMYLETSVTFFSLSPQSHRSSGPALFSPICMPLAFHAAFPSLSWSSRLWQYCRQNSRSAAASVCYDGTNNSLRKYTSCCILGELLLGFVALLHRRCNWESGIS